MTLLQLNKEYMQLMSRADKAQSRKEAVSLIHKATKLAEKISAIEDDQLSIPGEPISYVYRENQSAIYTGRTNQLCIAGDRCR